MDALRYIVRPVPGTCALVRGLAVSLLVLTMGAGCAGRATEPDPLAQIVEKGDNQAWNEIPNRT